MNCHLMWPSRPSSSEGYGAASEQGCGLGVVAAIIFALIGIGALWLMLAG